MAIYIRSINVPFVSACGKEYKLISFLFGVDRLVIVWSEFVTINPRLEKNLCCLFVEMLLKGSAFSERIIAVIYD